MEILFIVPNFPAKIKQYLILPSLELCIMSAVLKKEHCVSLVDMQINDYDISDLDGVFESLKPDIICIEDNPQIHCNSKKVIKKCRQIFGNNVYICLRGEIASFEPTDVLIRNPDLDLVLRYETDYVLNDIIECINFKKPFANVPSIGFRDNGEIILTQLHKYDYELDSLPFPDRSLYDLKKYVKRDSETIVRSSRGCIGNCLFCIKTKFEKFRVFSITRFCDELEYLVDFGFETFFFSDNIFAFSMKRLREFQKELLTRNLEVKWTSNIRIKDITDEKIALMKELGAYRVFVGIETINANTSKIINKNINAELILDKVSILKKYGMQFHASFILGNPGDTVEDLKTTMEFVKEINPSIVTYNLLKVFPGLELYNDPEKYNIIMPDKYWYENEEWTHLVVMGTEELPPNVLEEWSKKMLNSFISNCAYGKV